MSQKIPKKIKPERNDQYKHNPKEVVFQVSGPPLEVAPGETVEILIPSPKGFTVCFPIPGHFNAQIFEAVDLNEDREEMVAASGSGSGSPVEKFWGVRMTRISGEGAFPSGKFPYCIYSKELNNFAVGINSPPEMNLKP